MRRLREPASWSLPGRGRCRVSGDRRVVSSIAWTTFSNYVGSLLAIVRGVLFAGALGPALYGTWSVVSTLQTLSQFADLGVSQVAAREMPRTRARGELDKATAYARTSTWWMVLTSVISGLLVVVLWRYSGLPTVKGAWILLPLLFVGMNTAAVGVQVGRAFLAFRRVAVLTLLAGAAGLAAGWGSSVLAGLPGLVASQGAVYLLAAVPLVGIAGLRSFAGGWDVRTVRESIVAGWRLLVPGACLQVFVSLDVLMAGWLLGPVRTGYYGVALLSSSLAAGVLADSMGSTIGQYVLRDSGRRDSGVPRRSVVWGPAAAVSVTLAFACAGAIIVGPPLLRLVLPKFADAASPMTVLLVAAYYLHAQFGFSTTLVATGRQLAIVPVYVVLSALNVLIDVALVRAGYGIAGIAFGTLIVNVAFAVAHMSVVMWATGDVDGRMRVQVASTLGAGLLPAAAAVLAGGAGWTSGANTMGPAVVAGLASLGLACCLILMVLSKSWYTELRRPTP